MRQQEKGGLVTTDRIQAKSVPKDRIKQPCPCIPGDEANRAKPPNVHTSIQIHF